MPQLPPNRQLKKLGEISKVESGFGFPLEFQGKKICRYPFLKVSDMNILGNEMFIYNYNNSIDDKDIEKLRIRTFPKYTIIFPKIGGAISTNKKRILLTESIFDNNVMGLIPDSANIDFLYLYNFLLNINISNWATDSSLPSIKKTTVEQVEIPLPPLATQQKIVSKLDEIHDQIQDTRSKICEQISGLDELWSSSLHEIFANKDWERVKLGDVVEFNYGKGLDKSLRSELGSHPVYGANGVMNYSENYLYDGESIIVGRKGSAGAITRVSGKFWASDVTYYITFKKDGNMDYMYYLLYTLDLPQYAQGVKPGINRNTVYDIDIYYTKDLATQSSIVSRLDQLSQIIKNTKENYQDQLQQLDDLWASTLDKAFKGELVKE